MDILKIETEKPKSNGSSDMAHPASLEFGPFHCHWPITDPSDPLYPKATADRQPAGSKRSEWSKLQGLILGWEEGKPSGVICAMLRALALSFH